MKDPHLAIVPDFFAWMDQSLSGPIPGSTVAYHFNLYEGETSVHVQLMGTSSFDPGESPDIDYWPGTKTFSTGERIFEVPLPDAGSDWLQWLETCKRLINEYMSSGAKAHVLRASKGVGVGFVDGDMHVLWKANDA